MSTGLCVGNGGIGEDECTSHRSAEACSDDTRSDAVYPDVAGSEFWGQSPGQSQQGSLTHAVGSQGLQQEAKKATQILSCMTVTSDRNPKAVSLIKMFFRA